MEKAQKVLDVLDISIKHICSILPENQQLDEIIRNKTFPTTPESKFVSEDTVHMDNLVFVTESLKNALDHIMEARKALWLIGIRNSTPPTPSKSYLDPAGSVKLNTNPSSMLNVHLFAGAKDNYPLTIKTDLLYESDDDEEEA
jgi:hypothetical protein